VCEKEEQRYELINCEDAEYVFVAYGSSARICQKAIELGRAKGIKVGLIRPISLYPFPTDILFEMASKVKGMLSVEMNAGQMIEDVLLATKHKVKAEHFGRFGGIIPTPQEVLDALETKIIGG
jgi:2-oxoglutarate ferredoxin oxidoreductase subunit alpha